MYPIKAMRVFLALLLLSGLICVFGQSCSTAGLNLGACMSANSNRIANPTGCKFDYIGYKGCIAGACTNDVPLCGDSSTFEYCYQKYTSDGLPSTCVDGPDCSFFSVDQCFHIKWKDYCTVEEYPNPTGRWPLHRCINKL